MHNLFCDNCHSHVACALNKFKYNGKENYSMIDVWWMCSTRSKYVSWAHVAWNYLGFLVVFGIIALCVGLGINANN